MTYLFRLQFSIINRPNMGSRPRLTLTTKPPADISTSQKCCECQSVHRFCNNLLAYDLQAYRCASLMSEDGAPWAGGTGSIPTHAAILIHPFSPIGKKGYWKIALQKEKSYLDCRGKEKRVFKDSPTERKRVFRLPW